MRKGMEDAMNRRELRRQRRRRNQIIAYLVAGLILAAILFGCVFVIRSISGAAQGGNGGVQEEDGGAAGVEEPTGETASEQTETSGQSETPEPTIIAVKLSALLLTVAGRLLITLEEKLPTFRLFRQNLLLLIFCLPLLFLMCSV